MLFCVVLCLAYAGQFFSVLFCAEPFRCLTALRITGLCRCRTYLFLADTGLCSGLLCWCLSLRCFSSPMRFRSARPQQIESTLILASRFASLDCQYITFSCYASTRPVFTSPMLCESMPMLSLLSNSMPMRIVSLPCLYRSSPIFAPAYRLPTIQCHRTALPRQHLALPSPALPC